MPAGTTTVDPVLPDGHSEVIVHCGDPFREVLPDGGLRTQGRLLVAGQFQRAVRLSPTGASLIAGARLLPHGAAALFRIAQHELTDRIVELQDLNSRLARRLEDDVAGRRGHASLAGALDAALLALAADANVDLVAG